MDGINEGEHGRLLSKALNRYCENMTTRASAYHTCLKAMATGNKPDYDPAEMIYERDHWWVMYNITKLIEKLVDRLHSDGPEQFPAALATWRLLLAAAVTATGRSEDEITAGVAAAVIDDAPGALLPNVAFITVDQTGDDDAPFVLDDSMHIVAGVLTPPGEQAQVGPGSQIIPSADEGPAKEAEHQ